MKMSVALHILFAISFFQSRQNCDKEMLNTMNEGVIRLFGMDSNC